MLAFTPPLYLFGVKYLGFNLSPVDPMCCIALPLTIIAAYGADALIQRMRTSQHSRAVVFATTGVFLAVLITVGLGVEYELAVRWDIVCATLVVTGLLAAQFDKPRPALLFAALVITGTYISFPLMLRQPPDQLPTTSPLVEMMRTNLPADSRYAVAMPGIFEMQPNINAPLGLPSLHSYNSLTSWPYHSLIKALGGEMVTYGRWNGSIWPDYDGAAFWMSNIALMLSPTAMGYGNLDYLGQVGQVHLHRVVNRMGCCIQVNISTTDIISKNVQIGDPRGMITYQPNKTLDQGDLIGFDVRSINQASLLLISQKYHQDWQARALTPSGWVEVKTALVNGTFQGVLLPEGTQKVQMQFKSVSRFAWIAHVFWLLILAALAIQAYRSRIRLPKGQDA